MDFGQKIRARRIDLGLTLEEVAEAVGVAKATVQRWESGSIKNLRRDKLDPLADALNTTTAYLQGYIDDPDAKIKLLTINMPNPDGTTSSLTVNSSSIPECIEEHCRSAASEAMLEAIHDLCMVPVTDGDTVLTNIYSPTRVKVITDYLHENSDYLRFRISKAEESDKMKE